MKRFDPEMYDTVAGMVNEATSAASSSDYRALSYDDFTALRETVTSLWNLSRRNRQIEIDGKKLDRVEVQRSSPIASARSRRRRRKPATRRQSPSWEKTKRT
jgi:hypothetical protein